MAYTSPDTAIAALASYITGSGASFGVHFLTTLRKAHPEIAESLPATWLETVADKAFQQGFSVLFPPPVSQSPTDIQSASDANVVQLYALTR